MRFTIVLVCTWLTIRFTNPSTIYHWIRGQGNFKLYLLKAVCEISKILLIKTGQGVLENLNREFLLADLHVEK